MAVWAVPLVMQRVVTAVKVARFWPGWAETVVMALQGPAAVQVAEPVGPVVQAVQREVLRAPD